MKILNCKIKLSEVIYEVQTNKNKYFKYALPKNISNYKVRKVLKNVESKLDHNSNNWYIKEM